MGPLVSLASLGMAGFAWLHPITVTVLDPIFPLATISMQIILRY